MEWMRKFFEKEKRPDPLQDATEKALHLIGSAIMNGGIPDMETAQEPTCSVSPVNPSSYIDTAISWAAGNSLEQYATKVNKLEVEDFSQLVLAQIHELMKEGERPFIVVRDRQGHPKTIDAFGLLNQNELDALMTALQGTNSSPNSHVGTWKSLTSDHAEIHLFRLDNDDEVTKS